MREQDLIFFIENLELLSERRPLTEDEELKLIAAEELLWNIRNPDDLI